MDIVEKVAMAIKRSARNGADVWGSMSEADKEFMRKHARAALRVIAQEMKEPTPGMIGKIVDDAFDGGCEDESVIHDIWNSGFRASPLGPFLPGKSAGTDQDWLAGSGA